MKVYKFSEAAKSQMRKQLSTSILLTVLLFVISIGLLITKSDFYGRLVLAFALVGLIFTIIIIKKVRRINDVSYIKLYKDKIEINNNADENSKTFYFKDINSSTLTNKGIIFYVGQKDYRIITNFLEKSEVDELWKIFSKHR